MNRDALVLYLKNVRDLEVSRDIIGRMYDYDKRSYEAKIKEINNRKHPISKIPDFEYEPRGCCFIFCVIMLAIYLFMAILLIVLTAMGESDTGFALALMICGAIAFGAIVKFADPGSRKKTKGDLQKRS